MFTWEADEPRQAQEDGGGLRVILAWNGAYPAGYRWHGRSLQVLALQGVRWAGDEQRYRVYTREGEFELALDRRSGTWRVHRSPGWLNQIWARWRNGPRYPLPAWRRRSTRPPHEQRPAAACSSIGGRHADRFALV